VSGSSARGTPIADSRHPWKSVAHQNLLRASSLTCTRQLAAIKQAVHDPRLLWSNASTTPQQRHPDRSRPSSCEISHTTTAACRVGAQVRVTSSRLVLPYDEVLALSHAFRETTSNFAMQADSMSPFLGLFRDNSDRQLSVGDQRAPSRAQWQRGASERWAECKDVLPAVAAGCSWARHRQGAGRSRSAWCEADSPAMLGPAEHAKALACMGWGSSTWCGPGMSMLLKAAAGKLWSV
jgi:hypothetical protein